MSDRGISKRAIRRRLGRPLPGWFWDDDGWRVRAVVDGDRPPSDFWDSWHAFIESGLLHCRSRRQAAILDCGGIV